MWFSDGHIGNARGQRHDRGWLGFKRMITRERGNGAVGRGGCKGVKQRQRTQCGGGARQAEDEEAALDGGSTTP